MLLCHILVLVLVHCFTQYKYRYVYTNQLCMPYVAYICAARFSPLLRVYAARVLSLCGLIWQWGAMEFMSLTIPNLLSFNC